MKLAHITIDGQVTPIRAIRCSCGEVAYYDSALWAPQLVDKLEDIAQKILDDRYSEAAFKRDCPSKRRAMDAVLQMTALIRMLGSGDTTRISEKPY